MSEVCDCQYRRIFIQNFKMSCTSNVSRATSEEQVKPPSSVQKQTSQTVQPPSFTVAGLMKRKTSTQKSQKSSGSKAIQQGRTSPPNFRLPNYLSAKQKSQSTMVKSPAKGQKPKTINQGQHSNSPGRNYLTVSTSNPSWISQQLAKAQPSGKNGPMKSKSPSPTSTSASKKKLGLKNGAIFKAKVGSSERNSALKSKQTKLDPATKQPSTTGLQNLLKGTPTQKEQSSNCQQSQNSEASSKFEGLVYSMTFEQSKAALQVPFYARHVAKGKGQAQIGGMKKTTSGSTAAKIPPSGSAVEFMQRRPYMTSQRAHEGKQGSFFLNASRSSVNSGSPMAKFQTSSAIQMMPTSKIGARRATQAKVKGSKMLNSSDGESTCSNKHLGTLSKGKPPQGSSKMFSFEGGYNSPDSNSRPDSFVKKSPGKSKISPGSKYGSSHSKNNHSIHSSPTNFKEQKQGQLLFNSRFFSESVMEENASVNVPGRIINIKLSRQVSTAVHAGSINAEQSQSAHKQTEEDVLSNKNNILETQYANLGTVSEMSISNNEFDFSSIEEFKDEEKQEPLNFSTINPFPKIVEYLSPRPDLKHSILAGQANSPSSKRQSLKTSKRGSFKALRRNVLQFHADDTVQISPMKDERTNQIFPVARATSQNAITMPSYEHQRLYEMRLSTNTPTVGFDETDYHQSSGSDIDEANSAGKVNDISKTPRLIKGDGMELSPKTTLIDSIQKNLSLEVLAERHETSQRTRRVNQSVAMKKAEVPHVSKFNPARAESPSPIPKCEKDDQAGNWQGGAHQDALEEAIKQADTLNIPAHLIQPQEQVKHEHLIQTLQSLQYIQTQAKPPKSQIMSKAFLMPNTEVKVQASGTQQEKEFKESHDRMASKGSFGRQPRKKSVGASSAGQQLGTGYKARRTLLFDLDETLIHCVDNTDDPNSYQHMVEIKLNQEKKQEKGKLFSYWQKKQTKEPEEQTVKAGINVRPYAKWCLQQATELGFEVAIFTASHQAYADAVVDKLLDPERKYPRLYRQHCVRTNEGIYVKDLRVIRNRLVQDIILVDNAVYSFGFQLSNGIPILPFYNDPSDTELLQLVHYLRTLMLPRPCKSMQEANIEAFRLVNLAKQDLRQLLLQAEEQKGLKEENNVNDAD